MKEAWRSAAEAPNVRRDIGGAMKAFWSFVSLVVAGVLAKLIGDLTTPWVAKVVPFLGPTLIELNGWSLLLMAFAVLALAFWLYRVFDSSQKALEASQKRVAEFEADTERRGSYYPDPRGW